MGIVRPLLRRCCDVPTSRSGYEDGSSSRANSGLAVELADLLANGGSLEEECRFIFGSSTFVVESKAPNEGQMMALGPLYTITQRLIDVIGCRSQWCLTLIAEIYSASAAAAAEQGGLGLLEFSRYIRSVLTQALAELHYQAESSAHDEAERAGVAATLQETVFRISSGLKCLVAGATSATSEGDECKGATGVQHNVAPLGKLESPPMGGNASGVTEDDNLLRARPCDVGSSVEASHTLEPPDSRSWLQRAQNNLLNHLDAVADKMPFNQLESFDDDNVSASRPPPKGAESRSFPPAPRDYYGTPVAQKLEVDAVQSIVAPPPSQVEGPRFAKPLHHNQPSSFAMPSEYLPNSCNNRLGQIPPPPSQSASWLQRTKEGVLGKLDAFADSLDTIFAPSLNNGDHESKSASMQHPLPTDVNAPVVANEYVDKGGFAYPGEEVEPHVPNFAFGHGANSLEAVDRVPAVDAGGTGAFRRAQYLEAHAPAGMNAGGNVFGRNHSYMEPSVTIGGFRAPTAQEADQMLDLECGERAGMPVYVASSDGRWTQQRLAISGRQLYILDEGYQPHRQSYFSNLEVPKFELRELRKITRRSAHSFHALSLEFEEDGALLLRFSYDEYRAAAVRALVAGGRRVPVVDARD